MRSTRKSRGDIIKLGLSRKDNLRRIRTVEQLHDNLLPLKLAEEHIALPPGLQCRGQTASGQATQTALRHMPPEDFAALGRGSGSVTWRTGQHGARRMMQTELSSIGHCIDVLQRPWRKFMKNPLINPDQILKADQKADRAKNACNAANARAKPLQRSRSSTG